MIYPIIYESTETAFVSNGLGMLRDCIECRVVEERNSIYECNFSYPVDGANFDLIQCGRIIAVTHDDSGDIQPFDIVSYSKPINGVVEFHAVHISYRQSYLTIFGRNINSISAAFNRLGASVPSNPFTYDTDIVRTGYVAAFDGEPKTVRQMLGGVEGSILDTFGGEYEFDRFRVILHQNRGTARDFVIRYGVNLLDYKDETDFSGSYSAVIPYWKGNDNGDDTIVTATVVDSGQQTYNGRTACVPLDLSDKFEDKPTTAQLQTEALAYMSANQTTKPATTIHVDFVRLQDLGLDNFDDLLRCGLCDTIRVEFPRYGMEGRYKIVRTEWNVLSDRYSSMELGTLSTTLSEALGIGSGSTGNYSEGASLSMMQATGSGTALSLTAGTLAQVPLTTATVVSGSDMTITDGGIKVAESGIYQLTAGAYLTRASGNTSADIFIMGGASYSVAAELISSNEITDAAASTRPAAKLSATKAVNLTAGESVFLAVRLIGSSGTCATANAATFLEVRRLS